MAESQACHEHITILSRACHDIHGITVKSYAFAKGSNHDVISK